MGKPVRRRSPEAISGECGSLPVAGEECQTKRCTGGNRLSNAYNPARDKTMGRADLEGTAAANLSGHGSRHRCCANFDLPDGPCRIPPARLDESQSLRFGDGQPLLRCFAEERQDAVHLRSTAALEVRERVVSARRIVAVLVPAEASRAADGYLEPVNRGEHRHSVSQPRCADRVECCQNF